MKEWNRWGTGVAEAMAKLTRRGLLQFAGGGALGLHLGGLWRAQAAAREGRATTARPLRACILLFWYGGPSHLDTFDLKPEAPAEVRGEFRATATTVPGARVCEHLPRLGRLMHKVALVRSMTHAARLHDSAAIHALTGRPLEGPDRELFNPHPQFYPSFGSAAAWARRGRPAAVPVASLPFVFRNVHDVPCQGAGFLGAAYDPLRIEGDPERGCYRADILQRAEGMDGPRRDGRRGLLAALEGGLHGHPLREHYEKAYRLLDSEAIRRALDVGQEPEAVRERYGFGAGSTGASGTGAAGGYGRNLRGQNLLLARRLVEAGVPFVNVYDFKQQGQNWDAHARCAEEHREHLLPPMDRGLAALIEDLEARGLLESTLVVAMGEFGRTPRINKEGGRDHWPDCYTVLLAGGGVAGGAVHGASDRIGAYPARDPVTPGDLAATVYWRFGIDPGTEVRDATGRPHRLASGEPLRGLFGG